MAWAATGISLATNAGVVRFEDVGGGQTSVQLSLEYEPEGLLEKVGDKLNIVERQAEGDLDRFTLTPTPTQQKPSVTADLTVLARRPVLRRLLPCAG